jgi:hypothetical protein
MRTMNWDVTICEVENGYVARVGCKLFVFNSWEKLNQELYAYATGEETELAEQVKKELPQEPTCAVGGAGLSSLAESLAR